MFISTLASLILEAIHSMRNNAADFLWNFLSSYQLNTIFIWWIGELRPQWVDVEKNRASFS